MKRQKRLFSVLIFAILLVFTQGCAAPEPEDSPLTHLTVNVYNYMSFLPFYIAQEEGYFTEQGLDVEFVKFDRTSDSIAAIAQGQLDVTAGIQVVSTLNAIAQGANIRIVAERGQIQTDCDQLVVMANAETASLTLDQMAGRSIAAEAETFYGYFLDRLLAESTDLTIDDLEMLVLPKPTLGEALASGEVDFVSTSEPYITQYSTLNQGTVWANAKELMPGEQLGVIMFGPTLLVDNPDAGKRFMVAYMQGVRDYNEGKTETNMNHMMAWTGLEKDLLEDACWQALRPDLQLNTDSVLAFQEWAVGHGFYEGGLTTEDFWDPTFVDYAMSIVYPES